MPTPLECFLLIQANFEDDISGRLSATGGYCVMLSIMEAFIGVAVPSEETLTEFGYPFGHCQNTH